MNYSHHGQELKFNFEGRFLGFLGTPGKLKYLRLEFLTEEVQIKLPKELRFSARMLCQPGAQIRVSGDGKFDRHTEQIKFKARDITPISESADVSLPILPAPLPKKSKIKILICQKSGCLKKGGKKLYDALEKILRDRNLQDAITIERTGCLKRCSSAPNLILPGKRFYSGTSPATLDQLDTAIANLAQSVKVSSP